MRNNYVQCHYPKLYEYLKYEKFNFVAHAKIFNRKLSAIRYLNIQSVPSHYPQVALFIIKIDGQSSSTSIVPCTSPDVGEHGIEATPH